MSEAAARRGDRQDTTAPLVLPFGGTRPDFRGPLAGSRPGAAVLGRVTLGAGAALGRGAVIRADGHFVRIGDHFHLGDHGTVHIAHDVHPTIIGDGVAAGAGAVIHACTVGEDCVIGDGAIVLDGSVVEDGIVLAPGSVVYPRSELAGGQFYAGSPARPVRRLAEGEIAEWQERIRSDTGSPAPVAAPLASGTPGGIAGSAYVASTARLGGRVSLGPNASVWFGCMLDGGAGGIAVGADTNIQDNSRIRAGRGAATVIGDGTTIGHNAALADCRIGAGALIGIGAEVAAGVIVEDGVLLAAGATTMPGQVLSAGWLWAGRPARPIAPLDPAKRAMIAEIVAVYCGYAGAYAAVDRRGV